MEQKFVKMPVEFVQQIAEYLKVKPFAEVVVFFERLKELPVLSETLPEESITP